MIGDRILVLISWTCFELNVVIDGVDTGRVGRIPDWRSIFRCEPSVSTCWSGKGLGRSGWSKLNGLGPEELQPREC